MVCHASAWDSFVDDDVRIKQCTHVQRRKSDHRALWAVTSRVSCHQPSAQEWTRLLSTTCAGAFDHNHSQPSSICSNQSFDPDQESKINHFDRLALSKSVPAACLHDIKVQMGNFGGTAKPQDANGYFRKLREKYGGVEPSIVWTNRDFDITTKTMQALT